MAVKLDVLINYLFDNSKLKRGIADLNKQMIAAWSPYSREQILKMGQKENLKEYFNRLTISAKQYNDVLENTLDIINNINAKGKFSPLLRSMGINDRDYLTDKEKMSLAQQTTGQQIAELQAIETQKIEEDRKRSNAIYKEGADRFLAFEEEREKIEREEIERKRKEGEILQRADLEEIHRKSKNDAKLLKLKEKQQADYWIARDEYEKKEAKKQAQLDEKKKKDIFNALLMRWGKFGIAGIAIAKGLHLASKAISLGYSTSMTSLDWQRTISGGASGGTWFGQGLAAYQRAGLGANQYQGFKRGIQGYLGSVKLGMGNAAPLMYLGLSALGNPDMLEKQLERSLRRLPKDVSLALAGQMGLDYNMWEAIYSGRIDRQRSAYSEEAIQKWALVADRLNDILTSLKVFGFEKFANFAYNVTHPIEAIKQSSFLDKVLMGIGFSNPITMGLSAIKFQTVDVVVRNENGEVIGRGQTKPEIENAMYELGASK